MQHANLKGRLTKPALHDFVYKVDGLLAQGKFALGVFLDEEGAFDITSFELMGDEVCEPGVCPNILRIGGCFVALAMGHDSRWSSEPSGGLQLFYAGIRR
jgi:hypothetical protein